MKIVGAHRKGHDDLTNQALTWNINTGKRKPGRPKITWRRGFICELSVMPILRPNSKKNGEPLCAWPMLWKEEINGDDDNQPKKNFKETSKILSNHRHLKINFSR